MQVSWFLPLIAVLAAKISCSHADEQYIVICDAGSSGTRFKVFQYIKGRHDPIAPSDVKQIEVPKPDKAQPGLSEFANNIGGIKAYLGQLMTNVKKAVPVEKYESTPIHLLATAGMRLLSKEKKAAVLDEVDRLFSDKAFCPFHYETGFAKIISGEEEAVYGWVTINFLKGTFSTTGQRSYGALDLGGASTQNTFKISRNRYVPPTEVLSIAGKSYPLYAHSYLGDGANEAKASYIEYLTKVQKRSNHKLISPCHNTDYKETISVEGEDYSLIGKYNAKKCKRYIRKIFFKCKFYILSTCLFSNQPKLRGVFYGYGAFYYAIRDVGLMKSDDQIVTLKEIKRAGNQVCSKPPEMLDDSLYDVYGLCFRMNYIYELLKDGYRVRPKSFTLHIAMEMNGFELDWGLGAMLVVSKAL